MKQQPPTRVPVPGPNQARLEELMREIRDGMPGATAEFRRIFLPGSSFLIRRRLGEGDIQEHAHSVLEAAMDSIREDKSIESKDLPGLIRRLIVQRFPAGRKVSAAPDGADRIAVEAAKAALETMSPVERDALRRCYVLGEPPESFLDSLKLTPDQFREVRIRARTQFSTRRSNETNVA
jgi:hypothetical protein